MRANKLKTATRSMPFCSGPPDAFVYFHAYSMYRTCAHGHVGKSTYARHPPVAVSSCLALSNVQSTCTMYIYCTHSGQMYICINVHERRKLGRAF